MRPTLLISILIVTVLGCSPGIGPDTPGPQQLVFGLGFNSPSPGLFVINSDGTSHRRITHDTIRAFAPTVVSPNGQSLLYAEPDQQPNNSNVWRLDRGNLIPTLVVSSAISPCWHQSGSTIFFQSHRTEQNRLWSCTVNGTDIRQISPDSLTVFGNVVHSPVRPILAFFAFIADGPNRRDFVVFYDYQQQRHHLISRDTLIILGDSPSWAPAGDMIAIAGLVKGGGGYRSIYAVDTSGSAYIQLTQGESAYYPQWSPTAPEILYTAYGSISGLRIVNVNTRQNRILTTAVSQPMSSVWSPDGSIVALQADDPITPGSQRIYFISSSGGIPQPATTSTETERSPRWMKTPW